MYKENLTQEENILELLKQRGSKGVYVYELMTPKPHGLGIAQYNARILGLREKGYNIKNVEEGHFVLLEENLPLLQATEAKKEKTATTSNKIKHIEYIGNTARVTYV